jgi:hypothetical protein
MWEVVVFLKSHTENTLDNPTMLVMDKITYTDGNNIITVLFKGSNSSRFLFIFFINIDNYLYHILPLTHRII